MNGMNFFYDFVFSENNNDGISIKNENINWSL